MRFVRFTRLTPSGNRTVMVRAAAVVCVDAIEFKGELVTACYVAGKNYDGDGSVDVAELPDEVVRLVEAAERGDATDWRGATDSAAMRNAAIAVAAMEWREARLFTERCGQAGTQQMRAEAYMREREATIKLLDATTPPAAIDAAAAGMHAEIERGRADIPAADEREADDGNQRDQT